LQVGAKNQRPTVRAFISGSSNFFLAAEQDGWFGGSRQF
jgi:hypothetical protein